MKLDYTAFEVFAHDYDIPVGECEELGGYVNYSIPASVTNKFMLRIVGDIETNDIVIDWGDNSSLAISEIDDNLITFENNIFTYTVSHTYSSENKFIIKIYGKNYFNLQAVDPVDPEVRW
jgi:hypothetical protein